MFYYHIQKLNMDPNPYLNNIKAQVGLKGDSSVFILIAR